jgi:hypothetical protein
MMAAETHEEPTFSQGNGGNNRMTLEEVKQYFEAQVQSAVDEAMTRAGLEAAEPLNWWNLWSFGPWQPVRPGGPLRPHKIIKLGESAYIFTVLWLNPWLTLDSGPTVCDLVSNLARDFEIRYCTGNKCTWDLGPRELNATHRLPMEPDRCWYVDVLRFVPQTGWEGCYATHICARITGSHEESAPPLAGFATQVRDIDWELFAPVSVPPRWQIDTPIQFMIYP